MEKQSKRKAVLLALVGLVLGATSIDASAMNIREQVAFVREHVAKNSDNDLVSFTLRELSELKAEDEVWRETFGEKFGETWSERFGEN